MAEPNRLEMGSRVVGGAIQLSAGTDIDNLYDSTSQYHSDRSKSALDDTAITNSLYLVRHSFFPEILSL
jgi:hypothetical protein